jgi:hypothetical protein
MNERSCANRRSARPNLRGLTAIADQADLRS